MVMNIRDSLCARCKFFIAEDLVRSCPTANSLMQFCQNHKVEATIISCKAFKDKEAENQPKNEMEKLADSLGIKLKEEI